MFTVNYWEISAGDYNSGCEVGQTCYNLSMAETKQPTQDERQMAVLLHLSSLLSFVFFGLGIIVPLIIYLMKKDESKLLEEHGKAVLNFNISYLIYTFLLGIAVTCSTLLIVFLIGIPMLIVFGLLLTILGLAALVLAVIGAVKANDGELYDYPLVIKFLK